MSRNPAPRSNSAAQGSAGRFAVALAGVIALFSTLIYSPAYGGTAGGSPTSAVSARESAARADTWREVQGQLFLDKVKAKDWVWVKARLKNPKREFSSVKKMGKDKPLKLAGMCDESVPASTTAACFVKNLWAFGITKKGKDYTFYGFATLD